MEFNWHKPLENQRKKRVHAEAFKGISSLDVHDKLRAKIHGDGQVVVARTAQPCSTENMGEIVRPKKEMNQVAASDNGAKNLNDLKQQIALLPAALQRKILVDISKRLGSVLVDPADLATLRAAAKHLDIGLMSIQQQIKSGKLTTVQLADGRQMVRISDCEMIWRNGPLPVGRPSLK